MAIKGHQLGRGRASWRAAPLWMRIYIWTNSQVVIAQLKNTVKGRRQWFVRLIILRVQGLANVGAEVIIKWVSGYLSKEGNEQSYRAAKKAAGNQGIRRCSERFTSPAYID